jgi:ABC-type multidrug transport system ATPase subunit
LFFGTCRDDIFDSNRSLLWVIVVLIIDTFFYWGMIMVVETIEARCSRCRDSCILKCKGTGDKVVGGGGSNMGAIMEREPDPRVQEEIDRITKATAHGAGAVDMAGADADMLIANMSKTFVMSDGRLNEAVKDVCLGVKRGTVFGLLGMNGAGKTTLLHAIQGKHQASDGDCFIADPGADNKTLSCKHDVDRVRQLFGICPQHEVLWEFVTPREHLRAFANIRGVPAEAIEQVVEDLLTRLDLLDKAEEPSAKLSGGMKRRLSIAMSVIGSPKCVFLDEPTTGLDPNTRRFVWDYILEIKEGRIVVLTTHSMEEADALCTNIGIMVNGSLLSLGTPQQLKSMHGSGYRVTVRLKDDATTTEDETDPLRVALEEKYNTKEEEEQDFATVEYVATSSTKTTRVFAIAAKNLSLGGLFQLLEDKKEDLGILDYSVSQTTMEQVFTKFAQFQKDDTRAD